MPSPPTTIYYIGAWATFGTAIGTLALAIATFVMARKTREVARSSQRAADAANTTASAAESELELLREQNEEMRRQSAAAEEALNASVRPLIADVPRRTMQSVALSFHERMRLRNERGVAPGHREIDASLIVTERDVLGTDLPFLTVPIRNIGSGVALVVAARLAISEENLRGVPSANGVMASVVAPGEIVRVTFQHHEPQPGWLAERLTGTEALVVEISYTDISGRQEAASRLYLAPVNDDPDRSYEVGLLRPLVAPELR